MLQWKALLKFRTSVNLRSSNSILYFVYKSLKFKWENVFGSLDWWNKIPTFLFRIDIGFLITFIIRFFWYCNYSSSFSFAFAFVLHLNPFEKTLHCYTVASEEKNTNCTIPTCAFTNFLTFAFELTLVLVCLSVFSTNPLGSLLEAFATIWIANSVF